ncbi:Ig-like domain-containing protein [Flavobacteriaceae bacterium]|nr:Ig-like domain-containing protein [Flavobacteriaceae bacterium]
MHKVLYLLFAMLLITSCGSDDDTDIFIPLEIQTQEDFVQVSTLQTISIDIFANDTNIPATGLLSVTSPSNGDVVINNNNTPQDTSDDILEYDPALNFVGTDTLQYTICLQDGTNCKTETISILVFQDTTVTLNLDEFPYQTLSEYNFFNGALNAIQPAYGVLPYEPISSLFTDYAVKERFVWVPLGETASFDQNNKSLDFPEGSALIKMFYYNNVLPTNTTRIIETRVMVKTQDGWDFAEYVWNDAQTEAFLETTEDGGYTEVNWLQDGQQNFVNYRIPAKQQCVICHTNDFDAVPLGIKPQNINSILNYDDGPSNQLQKLIDFGYLEDALPANITTVVDWEDASNSLEQRAKSYLDINCANCHIDGGQGDYRAIRLGYTDTLNNDENAGVCVDADTPIPGLIGQKHIAPGDPENSIIYYRMSVTGDEAYKMPQFGQSLVHTEALALMEDWINSINQSCD